MQNLRNGGVMVIKLFKLSIFSTQIFDKNRGLAMIDQKNQSIQI